MVIYVTSHITYSGRLAGCFITCYSYMHRRSGLVSLGFTFLSGLNLNHLESRSSSKTAKRCQLELAALAPPKVLTAFVEEVAVLITSVYWQEVYSKSVGLLSGAAR